MQTIENATTTIKEKTIKTMDILLFFKPSFKSSDKEIG